MVGNEPKSDITWLMIFFVAKILEIMHIVASTVLAAAGVVYISQEAGWLVPFWLIWIVSSSFVSLQQLRFSYTKFLNPDGN